MLSAEIFLPNGQGHLTDGFLLIGVGVGGMAFGPYVPVAFQGVCALAAAYGAYVTHIRLSRDQRRWDEEDAARLRAEARAIVAADERLECHRTLDAAKIEKGIGL